ncbi:MAG: signal peptidase II [Erysipelotrichaceae bacterium]|nr:signal peptidase II [Erysipelotrichaceae bacterium]
MTVILYLFIIILLTCIDQYSKFVIIQNMDLGEKIVLIENFFSITHVRNYGAGFSILQNATVFLSAVSILAICILIYMLLHEKKLSLVSKTAYLLIISGALGNLIDRVLKTYVTDFLDFLIFGYDFPVFNIADSFITVGCFLLIGELLWESRSASN